MSIQHIITMTIRVFLFSTCAILYAQPINNEVSARNSVFVEQIGNANNSVAEISSQNGQVALIQLGTNNTAQFQMKAKHLRGIVIQKGAANNLLHLQTSPSRMMQTTIIQNGYNQNLMMLGANGLSEKMTVRMKGKNQTILVRNIKRQR